MHCLKIFLVLIFFLLSSCIKDFSFKEIPKEQALVIEGFVSDISYNDFSNIETAPRYFEVQLSLSSEVSNVKDEVVTNAEVTISNDLNENWDYIEAEDGTYKLEYDDFKIEKNRSYKLQVRLEDGKLYESGMEQALFSPVIGEIYWEEAEQYAYEYLDGEESISLQTGMDLFLNLPANQFNEKVNLKWDFEVTYVFLAYEIDFNLRNTDPNFQCWISDQWYFSDIVTGQTDDESSRQKLLFFDLDVYDIHDGFSILVRQHSGTSEYHQYWEGINQQQEQSDLFAPPPFNLNSNLKAIGHDGAVYGYFGVVNEYFYRWYFDKGMVSYDLPHPEEDEFCQPPFMGFEPAIPACYNCLDFSLVDGRTVTNVKPIWWQL